METWGAQGGSFNSTYIGGYGDYSTGVALLNKNEDIYVVIGGQGKSGLAEMTVTYGDGGYNGGGSRAGYNCGGCYFYSSGGGGATHIATKPGLLSELEEFKGTYSDVTGTYNSSEILIVSGGGGGNGYAASGANYNSTNIASGGGIVGNYGNNPSNGKGGGFGTQNSGAAFGAGANCINSGVCDGGGAGFYGGQRGEQNGGGGSGFIGSSRLISKKGVTKAMYCYNCTTSDNENTKTISTTNVSSEPISNYAKTGNGYAKITYLGK